MAGGKMKETITVFDGHESVKQIVNAFYGYDDIKNTSLKTILIDNENLHNIYPQIGYGCEGTVFKHDNKIAFKIFNFSKEKLLENKFKKIEFLGTIKDDSFEFPQGLVGFENGKKAGYFMNLIETDLRLKNYYQLNFVHDKAKVIEYLLKAEEAIKRIHSKGIIIGDMHCENIMIDRDDNARFIDTDNYATEDFEFDILPRVTTIYERVFKSQCSLIDNDKFTFSLMALQYFMDGTILSMSSSVRYFSQLIEFLDVNKYSKDVLASIFSDSIDKPYIGEMLREIDPEKRLIEKEYVYALNRIY